MTLTAIHRIEIVIASPHLPQLLAALRVAGAEDYTVLNGAAGHGHRGDQRADDVAGVTTNAYVIAAVAPEKSPSVCQAVRPLLTSVGGMCLVTESRWLSH